MKSLASFCAVLSLALLGGTVVHAAETFPNRPVRFVVPYAPGGNVDITARTIAPKFG